MNDWKNPILLKDHISYDWKDKVPGGANLGRAEFVFCAIFKRGRLDKMFISRKQQRNDDRYYFCEGLNSESFRFVQEGSMYSLPIWRTAFCKDHKSVRFDVYVPTNTKRLKIEYSSIMTDFCFF
jgi:hypothetical protein